MSGAPVLDAVRDLTPLIAKRSEEIEKAGRMPSDLLADLVDAGCYRMQLPRAYGGLELSTPDVMEVLAELSRADGAVGWTVMIASQGPLFFAYMSKQKFDEIYAEGPTVLLAGAVAPKGVAEVVDGGYQVRGSWPFASGIPHATWVVGHCLVSEGGQPRLGPDGGPEMRMALMPVEAATVLDTWHVLGMRGTASADFEVDCFVSDENCFPMLGAAPSVDWPANRIPIRAAVGPQVAAVSLGIAQGALDDLAALAPTKRPAMNPKVRLAEDPVFQHCFGDAYLRFQAARSFLLSEAQACWDRAVAGAEWPPFDRMQPRLGGAFVTGECVKVVDAAHTLAGSASLYESSSLQRRLRDVHVVTQHQASTTEGYRTLGAVLAGEPVDTSFF
ncbi:MAG: acyl-CoA dehydrogenase family protein [Actinobacteria bacterium]|nr:acyl-CoA dehydrogenase family protein [Actinomycetota bacterium]